jgi:sporulation protein YlmC with PRC-barrel domain
VNTAIANKDGITWKQKKVIYNDNSGGVLVENDEVVTVVDNKVEKYPMDQATRFIPTSRLKRYDVINKQGQDMGQVQTFVVDMVVGRIAFVVVSFEGFLGISDKWFALPWEMMSWSTDNKKFILDMSKETLEKAPGMDKNNWPDNIDFPMVVRTYNHFGVAPYWDSTNPEREIGAEVISGVVTPVQTLSSIAITPGAPANIAVGSLLQFAAIGAYADKSSVDITSKVIWTSSNPMVATLSAQGLATGVGIGITRITASSIDIKSPAVSLQTFAKPAPSINPEKEMAKV